MNEQEHKGIFMGHFHANSHHHHHHGHSGHYHAHHHDGDISQKGEQKLWYAIIANMLLTAIQVLGGIVSGSLSLIADALHNFSDAASLVIALVAIRIGRLPADDNKTFGYKRAETIAALINLTSLIMIGLFLMSEAIQRFFVPEPITGWIVVVVAGGALFVDVFTALITYAQSKNSMNMRAAFLHNLTDAMASVGVIVAGTLILLYGWVWIDALMTLVISAYVLMHGFHEVPRAIHLLMEGTPSHLTISDVIDAMEEQEGVEDAHHVHIWQINEQSCALEAHILLDGTKDMDALKTAVKAMLEEKFKIDHATLEFEHQRCKPASLNDD